MSGRRQIVRAESICLLKAVRGGFAFVVRKVAAGKQAVSVSNQRLPVCT